MPTAGSAELVSDCVVEPEHGDTDEDQCDQVRNQEGAAAVGVGDAGETPDVAQADGRADGCQEEACLAAPRVARAGRGFGCGG